MARGKLIKNNFNAGEWSTLLAGRTDLEKYYNSASDMDNMVPVIHGPAMARPGFEYIAATKDSTKTTRMIPFKATDDTAYQLEFGDLHFRVYTAAGRVGSVEVTTPYAHGDLVDLKFAQSADVLYITHPDYAPRKIVRVSNTVWAISEVDFYPPPCIETPGPLGSTLHASGTLTPAATSGTSVLFTAGASIFLPGDIGRVITFVLSIAGVTYAGITVTVVQHVSATKIYGSIHGTLPDTSAIPAAGWKLSLSPTATLTASSKGPAGKQITLYVTTGNPSNADALLAANNWWTAGAQGFYLSRGGAPPATMPAAFFVNGVAWPRWAPAAEPPLGWWTWDDLDAIGSDRIYLNDSYGDPDGWGYADEFLQYAESDDINVFRASDVGRYIFIHGGVVKILSQTASVAVCEVIRELDAITATLSWTMEDAIWDLSDGSGKNNPRSVAFYDDRLWFGGSPTYSQTFWGSETGLYENFTHGAEDSDSLSFTILSRVLTKIHWLESGDSLFIGTSGGVWRANGGATEVAITPSNVSVRQATNVPSSSTQPVIIGSNLLYVHKQGKKIFEVDQDTDLVGKRALDISVMGEHLLIGGVTQLCYQPDPYGIIWMTRGDGALIGMTYQKEQNVVALHYHITDGTVESTSVVSGTTYDELWCVVNRTINSATVRYIEKMTQYFETTGDSDYTDAEYSDSCITISSPGSTTLTGLTHLEGETVAILADGKEHSRLVVSGGEITLDFEPTTAQVGMPYDYWAKSHKLETQGYPATSQGSKQRVVKVQARFNNTVAAQAGPDADNLDNIPFRKGTTGLDTAIPLFTGDKEIPVKCEFGEETTAMIKGSSPLPMTVVAIMPTIEIGE